MGKYQLGLEKGKSYRIELYPQDKKVNARYLGKIEDKYVFDSKDSVILVDNHWICFDKGIITHQGTSEPIVCISKEEIEEESDLVKKLREARLVS